MLTLRTLERWIDRYVIRPTVLGHAGGTIWRRGLSRHRHGYAVGVASIIDPGERLPNILGWLVANHPRGVPTFGGWWNPFTREADYDLGLIVENLDDAVRIGRRLGQATIWDIEEKVVILLDFQI